MVEYLYIVLGTNYPFTNIWTQKFIKYNIVIIFIKYIENLIRFYFFIFVVT